MSAFQLRPAALLLLTTSAVLLMIAGSAPATGSDQAIGDYQRDNPLLTTPGVTGGSLAAFANPAAWADNDKAEAAFWWTDHDDRDNGLDDWGFSWGNNVGLAIRHRTHAELAERPHVTDWQLGAAFGDRRAMAGVAYRWPTGGSADIQREKAAVLGAILRPGRGLSLGASGVFSLESEATLGVCDLGLRPFASPLLTLYGDYSLRDGQRIESGLWGLGAETRLMRGVRCGVKFHESANGGDPGFTLQLGITLQKFGIRSATRFDGDGNSESRSYALRLSPPESPLRPREMLRLPGFRPPEHGSKLMSFDLQGRRLTYRTHRWFERRNVAWLPLAKALDSLAERPDVGGVALNLAGFTARPSLAWELRSRLEKLREAGKKVYIHTDRMGLVEIWTAAVADHLTMDPQGLLTLPGLSADRTYMKDLLDRLGIGFEALQLFPHKTAVEVLSRSEMSAADQEQLSRLLDVIYERVRADVCRDRGITFAAFDSIIDDKVMVLPETAVAVGLVDAVSRWEDMSAWLGTNEPGLKLQAWDGRGSRRHHADRWGEPPEIAVVYAVGGCEMDSGIKGRETSRRLRGLISDRDVKAVVLRVDSPGGDPLPSDLVAEAVRDLRAAGIEVIVSQGDVAASGGYWLSMDGDSVLTTPVTVTGSIGVISGWIWDDTLHEKTGIRADGVSRGAHADLFRRTRLPLVGLSLPARGLDADERETAHARILGIYDSFVAAVASGRGMSEAEVRELGGGRIWMGPDAIANGLCDAEGGLVDAIAAARGLARIPAGAEVSISEYPPRPLFRMPRLPLRLLGLETALRAVEPAPATGLRALFPQAEADFLQQMADGPGRPLTLLPPGYLPAAWSAGD